MRILHTSDWHLGQHFMGKSRLSEHEAFLQWLIGQIRDNDIDAVLVVGDLFDTGTPPSYARELYNNVVVAVQATGARLILLGGNHDSAAVLGESRALLACLNTQVVSALADAEVIPLTNRQGTVSALLCALPFLRARDVLTSQAGQGLVEKQQDLQQAIAATYERLYQQALSLRETHGPVPLIATGHLTTVGAQMSESVRDIYIGTLEAFPAAAFPAFDYIALGHIHKPQRVGGLEHIRYCGSPLPLSFDEAGQPKQVLMASFDNGGLQSVDAIAVPCFQPLRSVRGSLATLEHALQEAARAGTPAKPVWLDITVSVDGYLSDLHSPIRKMTEGLPVEVLRIHRERQTQALPLRRQARETLVELTPLEVFQHRLALETLEPDQQAALKILYQQIIGEIDTGHA